MSANKFIWIASYPRSGNTWIRFILANLLRGPISNSGEMEKIVPDVHDDSFYQKVFSFGGIFFCKTHWTYERVLSSGYETAGAVYIYRNPLDIISSHINYLKLSDDSEKIGNFVEQFVYHRGAPHWFQFQMGSWKENIEGWVFKQKQFPCLILRYEDLKMNPYVEVLKLCEFLGIDKTQTRIEQSIRQSSFENLRSMERRDIRDKTPGIFKRACEGRDSSEGFMYKGNMGTYKAFLTNDQTKKIVDRFNIVMKKLGYSVEVSDYLS